MLNKGKHVMLDLETMSSESNAAIVAIGAVEFNMLGMDRSFYSVVDLNSSIRVGGHASPDTIKWWLQQSTEARTIFDKTKVNMVSLEDALNDFAQWLPEDAKIWGNGASFDNVILSNAYMACGIKRPWKYYNDMCYRTIKNLYPDVPMDRQGTHHNALHDAVSQASHLINIFRLLEA